MAVQRRTRRTKGTNYAELGSNLAECSTEDAGTQASLLDSLQEPRPVTHDDFLHISTPMDTATLSLVVSHSLGSFLFREHAKLHGSWMLLVLVALASAVANTSY